MAYVECFHDDQKWCTHSSCQRKTGLCLNQNPDNPWRLCQSYKNHKGKCYAPPVSFNYVYWEPPKHRAEYEDEQCISIELP